MIKLNTVTRKLIWLMAVFLIITLTSCGADKKSGEDKPTVVLAAQDADLTDGRGIILEPKNPPFNLGGWRGKGTAVWKDVKIPVDGHYKILIEYSREHTNQNIWGTINIKPKDSSEENLLPFRAEPTSSAVGDWSVYKYMDTLGIVLKAGSYLVEMYPGAEGDPLPHGEHFLNLRSIKFVLKEAKDVGDKKGTDDKKDVADKKDTGDKKDAGDKKSDDKDANDNLKLVLPTGKWFKNGIKGAGNDYAEVDEAGTISLFDSNGKQWLKNKTTVTLNKNVGYRTLTAQRIDVEMDRSSGIPTTGEVSADLKTLVVTTRDAKGMDVTHTITIYLHESVVDTPEAHELLQRAKLFGYFWKAGGKDVYFYSDGTLFVLDRRFGKWTYENGVLTANWEGEVKDDGKFSRWDSAVKEECKVNNVEEGFTLPAVGRITGSNIHSDEDD